MAFTSLRGTQRKQMHWRGDGSQTTGIHQTTDKQLWQMRNLERKHLIDRVRTRYAHQLGSEHIASHDLSNLLNEDVLTLGFAGRFATYKRPNLLLHDPERLRRILHDPQRPVQLVIAGKAHPNDGAGQAMIRQWTEFTRQAHGRPSVIFLSDYDMLMTQELVSGVDVWINTPRRPWEASGTSGMKV